MEKSCQVIEILFWIGIGIVFYTYLGYGIVLYLMVKIKKLFVTKAFAFFSSAFSALRRRFSA